MRRTERHLGAAISLRRWGRGYQAVGEFVAGKRRIRTPAMDSYRDIGMLGWKKLVDVDRA